MKTFRWNKVKYRADKPIADLVDSLHKVRLGRVLRKINADRSFRKSQLSTTMSKQSSHSITKSKVISLPPNAVKRMPKSHFLNA